VICSQAKLGGKRGAVSGEMPLMGAAAFSVTAPPSISTGFISIITMSLATQSLGPSPKEPKLGHVSSTLVRLLLSESVDPDS
jgi:hypothetical protein